MEKRFKYEVHDDAIPVELQEEVWNYLQGLEYYVKFKDNAYPKSDTVLYYTPNTDTKEYYNQSIPSWNSQYMHRTLLGNNEDEVNATHPVIGKLWNSINGHLGNRYAISGVPEGVHFKDKSKRTKDGGMRVYVNVQGEETIKRSHTVHRDSPIIEDNKNFTLLYMANPAWYPTWFGELVFYENDTTKGDFQQFQKGYGQMRSFGVGHPHSIIPVVPGRIVLYDGRTLHTTRPTSVWAEAKRYAVAFRIRLRPQFWNELQQ